LQSLVEGLFFGIFYYWSYVYYTILYWIFSIITFYDKWERL